MNATLNHPYRGDIFALITKHEKDRALRPTLRSRLGVSLEVPAECDTYTLGTFSGEVARTGTQAETVLKKASWEIDLGLSYSIASEGSFGPHPAIPFISAGQELLGFIDQKRKIKLIVHDITTECCFDRMTAHSDDAQLKSFLTRNRIPNTAMLVSPNSNPQIVLAKGIRSSDELHSAIRICQDRSSDGLALIQTDMRACYNSARMWHIRKVAHKLAERLSQLCPSCQIPGWGQIDVIVGLSCEDRGSPTNAIWKFVDGCCLCDHRLERDRPDKLTKVNPRDCPQCNP